MTKSRVEVVTGAGAGAGYNYCQVRSRLESCREDIISSVGIKGETSQNAEIIVFEHRQAVLCISTSCAHPKASQNTQQS